MAGWFDSPSLFSGQAWSAWKQHLDKLSGLLVNQDNNSGLSSNSNRNGGADSNSTSLSNFPAQQHSTSGKNCSVVLKPEDMVLFGHYQTTDDSYFVVCELCGDILRPHALKRHIAVGHSSSSSGKCQPQPEHSSNGNTNSAKIEDNGAYGDCDDDEIRLILAMILGGEQDALAKSSPSPPNSKTASNDMRIGTTASALKEQVLLPQSCFGRSPPAFSTRQQTLLPRSDLVPYWHTFERPMPITTGHSAPEFVIDDKVGGSSVASSHRLDFVRSALSRLVNSLQHEDPDDGVNHLVKSEHDVSSHIVSSTNNRHSHAIDAEKLLDLLAKRKHGALLEKLSPSFLAALRSGSVSLQHLSSRDRYILSHLSEPQKNGETSQQQQWVSDNGDVAANVGQQSQQTNVKAEIGSKRRRVNAGKNGNNQLVSLEMGPPAPSESTKNSRLKAPPPVTTVSPQLPPPPRPTILRGNNQQSSTKASWQSQLPPNRNSNQQLKSATQQQAAQVTLMMMSPPPPPVQQQVVIRSSPPKLATLQQSKQPAAILPKTAMPNNVGGNNGTNKRTAQSQQHQQVLVVTSPSPVKQARLLVNNSQQTLQKSPVKSQPVRLIAGQQRSQNQQQPRQILPASNAAPVTTGGRNFSPTAKPAATAFIAIAAQPGNSAEQLGLQQQSLAMLTIPVTSATAVMMTAIQQQQTQLQPQPITMAPAARARHQQNQQNRT